MDHEFNTHRIREACHCQKLMGASLYGWGAVPWNSAMSWHFIREKVKEEQGLKQRSHLPFPLFYLVIFSTLLGTFSQPFSLSIEYLFFVII